MKKHFLITIFLILISFVVFSSFFDYTHFKGITAEEDDTIPKKIFNRAYFITNTISTIGHGDITPKSFIMKFTSMIIYILIILHIIGLLD